MKPTYVETIPESVSAAETQAASRKYCPTQDETSTPFVAPKAQPIVHTDPSDLTGTEGMAKGGKP